MGILSPDGVSTLIENYGEMQPEILRGQRNYTPRNDERDSKACTLTGSLNSIVSP